MDDDGSLSLEGSVSLEAPPSAPVMVDTTGLHLSDQRLVTQSLMLETIEDKFNAIEENDTLIHSQVGDTGLIQIIPQGALVDSGFGEELSGATGITGIVPEQQQYIINAGELPEGLVGVDGSYLSQAFVPVVMDTGNNVDFGGMMVTAQIVDNTEIGGQKMIILTPSHGSAGVMQTMELPDSQSDLNIDSTVMGSSESPILKSEDLGSPLMEEEEPEEHDLGCPEPKRIKLETHEETQPMLMFTVSENEEEVTETTEEVISNVKVSSTSSEAKSPAHAPVTARVMTETDVTQAWFTTKDDKMALQNKGHQWKQGQWTKEEVELLDSNIARYCVDHKIEDPTDVIFQFSKEERKDFYRTVAKGLQRPLFSVYRRVIRMYDQKNHIGKYAPEEISKLKELRAKHGSDWATIGAALGRSASSVKDRCRLMKDTCNSGKWLPNEERLLAQSVYDLSGCTPGESVTKGLSWAAVAEKVATRSEKQCRTKWLNYLNWKQLGGTEWTRDDDIMLINKLSSTLATDETQVDWNELSENWPSARSPQWLRGKWWTLKRHVPDYQNITLTDLLDILKRIHYPKAQMKLSQGVASLEKLGLQQFNVLPNMTLIPVSSTADCVTSTTAMALGEEVDQVSSTQCFDDYSTYPSVITSQPQGAFFITQSQPNPAIAFSGANLSTDHIIVHTLPCNSVNVVMANGIQDGVIHSPDVLADTMAVQLIPQTSQVIINAEDSHNAVRSMPTGDTMATLQLDTVGQSEHDLEPLTQSDEIGESDAPEISQSDLAEHITSQSEIMSSTHHHFESQISGSDLGNDVTQSHLDDHTELDGHVSMSGVTSASPQFVQSTSNDFIENMSSLSDPMLPPSESADLIGSSSDVETDKNHCDAAD